MRLLAALVPVVLLAVAFATGARAADSCDGVASLGSIELRQLPMSYVVDHGVDSAGMEVQARTLSAYLGPGWHVRGLASARTSFQSNLLAAGFEREGEACVGLSSLVVTYGYPEPVRISVLSKYREGSCEYAAVMAHELQHYAIYGWAAFEDPEGIRARIEREVSARLPLRAATMAEAVVEIRAIVARAVQAESESIENLSATLNARLDTPENYRLVQSQCGAW